MLNKMTLQYCEKVEDYAGVLIAVIAISGCYVAFRAYRLMYGVVDGALRAVHL